MNHTWNIADLKRVIADGMVTDVVWCFETEHENFTTRTIGDITLTTGSVSDSSFIDYSNLTQNDVLGWITGSIDQSTMETNHSASIADDIVAAAAITKYGGTPW